MGEDARWVDKAPGWVRLLIIIGAILAGWALIIGTVLLVAWGWSL